MNLKPEGLIVPDCECFQKKLRAMNWEIDKLTALYMMHMMEDVRNLNLCHKAFDYYIAAVVWAYLSLLIPNKSTKPFSEFRKEYEEVYERIKPLVMQRLDYADGVMQSGGGG